MNSQSTITKISSSFFYTSDFNVHQKYQEGLLKYTLQAPTLSFWIRRSWLGPKNLRFPQISTWCWQYWFRNKALRTAILYYGSTQIKWKRENKKQAHLITTSETCVWLLKTHFPEPHCLNMSPSSTTYNVHVFLVIPLSSSVKWRWEYSFQSHRVVVRLTRINMHKIHT